MIGCYVSCLRTFASGSAELCSACKVFGHCKWPLESHGRGLQASAAMQQAFATCLPQLASAPSIHEAAYIAGRARGVYMILSIERPC